MAEIGKNTVQPIVKRKGQILKTVSSPSTSGSKKQVTNIVLDNGVLKASSDNGDTFEDITVKTAQNAQGAYVKPSGGIPKSDLAQDVQTSLGKADTALQSVPIATSTKVGGVKPASKTTEMTQSVGVDSNGALWTKPASGGTTVVANPSAAGTEDLLKLQVENTVYNIPATEIVFSTDAASGAAEVSGFSVEGQNFAFNLQNNNCVIGKTISNPTTGITYIKCTLSGTVSAAGNYFFVNCSGTLTVSGTTAKVYVTDSPALTVNGITSDNWRNVFVDGIAEYAVSNSTSTIDKDTSIGTVIANFKIISDDYVFIRYTWTDLSALEYKSSILQRVDGSNISTYAMTGVYATLSKQTAVSVLTSDATSENITLTTNSFNNQDGRFTINSITVRRYL